MADYTMLGFHLPRYSRFRFDALVGKWKYTILEISAYIYIKRGRKKERSICLKGCLVRLGCIDVESLFVRRELVLNRRLCCGSVVVVGLFVIRQECNVCSNGLVFRESIY